MERGWRCVQSACRQTDMCGVLSQGMPERAWGCVGEQYAVDGVAPNEAERLEQRWRARRLAAPAVERGQRVVVYMGWCMGGMEDGMGGADLSRTAAIWAVRAAAVNTLPDSTLLSPSTRSILKR